MKKEPLSETYTYLYNYIIQDLLAQICTYYPNYSVHRKIGNEDFPIALEKKFEEYKNRALNNMSGARLDRHKLASCICGAIIEIQPLVRTDGKKLENAANELLALHVGVHVIKTYMIYAFIYRLPDSYEKKKEIKFFLRDNFDIQFPLQNVCDERNYKENLISALYQTHFICSDTGTECFRFDIWAYAKIFYHLELYNQTYLKEAYQKYRKTNHA